MGAPRRVALPTKRFSLAIVGDGWDEAYLTYDQLTAADMLKLQNVDPKAMSDTQGVNFAIDLAKSHFRGGKLPLDGHDSLQDMLADDIAVLPVDVLKELFMQLSGGSFDPKGGSPMTESQQTPELSTEPSDDLSN